MTVSDFILILSFSLRSFNTCLPMRICTNCKIKGEKQIIDIGTLEQSLIKLYRRGVYELLPYNYQFLNATGKLYIFRMIAK